MRYTEKPDIKLKQINAVSMAVDKLKFVLKQLSSYGCPVSGKNTEFQYALDALKEIDKL